MTYVGERRLHMCGNCLVRASKTIGVTRKQAERLMGSTHHAGLATIPSSSLRIGAVHLLSPPCLWDRDQTVGETNCGIVQETSKDILDENAHFLCEDGTSQCPLSRSTVTWPFQSLKNTCESNTFTGLKNLSATVSMTFRTQVYAQ